MTKKKTYGFWSVGPFRGALGAFRGVLGPSKVVILKKYD